MDILGRWILDPTDVYSFEIYGNISMEFKEDGGLIYIIHSDEKDEIILMTYEISNDLLITDQPSSPNREETKFAIRSDAKLELFFGGVKSVFVRE